MYMIIKLLNILDGGRDRDVNQYPGVKRISGVRIVALEVTTYEKRNHRMDSRRVGTYSHIRNKLNILVRVCAKNPTLRVQRSPEALIEQRHHMQKPHRWTKLCLDQQQRRRTRGTIRWPPRKKRPAVREESRSVEHIVDRQQSTL